MTRSHTTWRLRAVLSGMEGAKGRRVRQHATRLVVELGNRAQSWRDAALDAELAGLWWRTAAPGEREAAAATYLAAIEREEKAASEYERASDACCATLPELRASAGRSRRPRRRWRFTYEQSQ
jgi:hypothetical protein